MYVARSWGGSPLIVRITFFVALAGCNALLGIDDAEMVPSAGAGGEGGAGQAGVGGGSGGVGGQAGVGGGAGAGGAGAPVVEQIVAGDSTTCALLSDGKARCWGYNFYGQLGLGHKGSLGDDELPNVAKPIAFDAKIVQIAVGGDHVCALLESGDVYCWGHNDSGQLGLGHPSTNNEQLAPGEPVALGGKAKQIALGAGGNHACALLDDDSVRCWGKNNVGQLGLEHTKNVGLDSTPASVDKINLGNSAKQVVVGYQHTCAILYDDTVRCWGYDLYGQLGVGHDGNVGDTPNTPVSAAKVELGGNAKQLALGRGHGCALLDEGVRCWGYNGEGQLGYGFTDPEHKNDYNIPSSYAFIDLGGKTAKGIRAGNTHTCALLDDDTMRCWGVNEFGQLGLGHKNTIGDGELPTSVGPVDVGGSVRQISVGYSHTCALVLDSETPSPAARCWGYNGNGQLGLGNKNNIGDDEALNSQPPIRLVDGAAGAGGQGGS